MATRAGFQYQTFKKVIGRMSSENADERHTACDIARKMAEDNGMHLYEAVERVYATVGSNEDLIEARNIIEQLQDEAATLKSEKRTLQDGVELLHRKVAELSQRRVEIREDAHLEFLAEVWSYPQARLIGCFLIMSIGFWLDASNVLSHTPWAFRIIESLIAFMVLMELGDWLEAEYCRSGAAVSLLKVLLILPGIYGALAAFFGDTDIRLWLGAAPSLTQGIGVIGLTCLITISKICPWIADKLAHSDEMPLRLLRQWF